MEKYLFEREWKEAVLIRKDNKSTVLVINGEEMEICCPKIVRGNITEGGMPCLVSEGRHSKNGKYEIMAFSLDNPKMGNKDWICLRPIIFEDAIEHFLASHQMEELDNGCKVYEELKVAGKKWDLVTGNAYIEINVPDAILNAAGGGWMQVKSLMLTAEKIARYESAFASLGDTGKKMVFLTIFQHGLNERMQDWLCRELSRYFAMDMDERVEFWIADLKLEPDGIGLLSYQNITGRVLLS